MNDVLGGCLVGVCVLGVSVQAGESESAPAARKRGDVGNVGR